MSQSRPASASHLAVLNLEKRVALNRRAYRTALIKIINNIVWWIILKSLAPFIICIFISFCISEIT